MMNIIAYTDGMNAGGRIWRAENIIIHFISNPKHEQPYSLQAAVDVLNLYRVSSNYLIGREGEEDGQIWQLVPPTQIAYHAGKSEYNGVSGLNKNSIGIELIGDKRSEFTDKQYESLSDITVHLLTVYPTLKPKNIKAHQVVSDSSVRSDPKPDPGRYFDWIRYGYDVMSKLNA